MPKLVIDLWITPEEYQRSYLGVRTVIATARDGRRVQFPVDILRPYVTHEGVIGTFLLRVDQSYKLIEMERLNP